MNLKVKLIKIFCITSFMFLSFPCVYGFNGIVIDQRLVTNIHKRIQFDALTKLCDIEKIYINFEQMYAVVDENDIYKMSYVIPILNSDKNKVIGEIKSSLKVRQNDENINALSFITTSEKRESKVVIHFEKIVADFFVFGGVSLFEYKPSIYKTPKFDVKKSKKTNTGKYPINSTCAYSSLKEKTD